MKENKSSKNCRLRCLHPGCGREYDDSEFRLQCEGEISGEHGPALLQAVYKTKQIQVRTALPGIFQYADWLPVDDYYIDPVGYSLGRPFCYKSEGLAKRLDLDQLYIAFNGYWPERGANLLTRTFKEFECQVSIVRYLMTHIEGNALPYIISSAGNTGNAYNLISHLLELPLYLVIPETGFDKLILPFKTNPFVVVVKGDYSDAIHLADKVASKTGLVRDGGVRNIAIRAGASTVILNAVVHPEYGSKQIFDHYFQAVGSGTGAIATWEAVQLLLADSRFGNTVTKIHIAQNAPFSPMADSWKIGGRNLIKIPDQAAKEKIFNVTAGVLTNRHPAYSIAGGIFDVLSASKGMSWKVNNYQVFHAARLFKEAEGIDIVPAAAVAVDALRQAVTSGQVRKGEKTLLNITGGGKEIQYSNDPVYSVEPNIIINPDELDLVIDKIGNTMRISNQKDVLKKHEYVSRVL